MGSRYQRGAVQRDCRFQSPRQSRRSDRSVQNSTGRTTLSRQSQARLPAPHDLRHLGEVRIGRTAVYVDDHYVFKVPVVCIVSSHERQERVVDPTGAYRTYPSSYDNKPSAVAFRLPLAGPVTVAWGGADEKVDRRVTNPEERWGYDLLVTVDGVTHRGSTTALSDYYAYDRPVHAPGTGRVVDVHDGDPDAPPGRADRLRQGGNRVVLEVAPGMEGLRRSNDQPPGADVPRSRVPRETRRATARDSAAGRLSPPPRCSSHERSPPDRGQASARRPHAPHRRLLA
jgi:hypothetical protein